MLLDNIINNPKHRLNQVLTTLIHEYGVKLDFTDKESLKDLAESARQIIQKIKDEGEFNSYHANPQVVCSSLVLEAIKIQEDIEALIEIEKPFMATKKSKYLNKPKMKKKVTEGTEIDKAELLLASKSIVDDLQSMIEKISKAQVQSIPPIVDRIKVEYGIGAAGNYREQSFSLLQSVIDALGAAKDGIDNLTLGLSGDVDMASDTADTFQTDLDQQEMPTPPGRDELDLEEPDQGMQDLEEPIGRERKEESRKVKGKVLAESSINAGEEIFGAKYVKIGNMMKKFIESYLNKKGAESGNMVHAQKAFCDKVKQGEAPSEIIDMYKNHKIMFYEMLKFYAHQAMINTFSSKKKSNKEVEVPISASVYESAMLDDTSNLKNFSFKIKYKDGKEKVFSSKAINAEHAKKRLKGYLKSKAQLSRVQDIELKETNNLANRIGVKKVKENSTVAPVAPVTGSNSQQKSNSDQQKTKMGSNTTPTSANPITPNVGQGQKVMYAGKEVTIATDTKGAMIGVQDVANGPVKMVPKTAIKAYQNADDLGENASGGATAAGGIGMIPKALGTKKKSVVISRKKVSEAHSHNIKPIIRHKRLGDRMLEKYSHDDFIQMAHAVLGHAAANELEHVLDGHSYSDQKPEHLEKIAAYAEKKGEFKLANDIKSYINGSHPELLKEAEPEQFFIVKVKERTVPSAVYYNISAIDVDSAKQKASDEYDDFAEYDLRGVRPGQKEITILKSFTNFDDAEKYKAKMNLLGESKKSFKVIVETNDGLKKQKVFVSEAEAKSWIKKSGHHFKSVKAE